MRSLLDALQAGRLIEYGDADVMVAGGAEATISPLGVGGFCAARALSLPVDSPLMRALLKTLPGSPGAEVTSLTTQLNVVNLGNAQILTIPGEALPNIGYYLKRKMHGQHNLLFGLTNDAFGYILTKEDYDSFKRYEYISRTSLGERTGKILVEEALRLVKDSPAPEKLANN